MSDRSDRSNRVKALRKSVIRDFARFLTSHQDVTSYGLYDLNPVEVTVLSNCVPLVRGMTAERAEEFIAHELDKAFNTGKLDEFISETML